MRIFITLLVLAFATTTYASGTFEQAYKNARTAHQKIRVLIGELQTKNAEIQYKDSVIKNKDSVIQEKDSQIQTLLTQSNPREQDQNETIRMLRSSNEDKSREIQRLATTTQRVEYAAAPQTIVSSPIITKPMKAILSVEIDGVTTNLEVDLNPVMQGEQSDREKAMSNIFGQLNNYLVKAVLQAGR